jgi:hypothetical protein
MVKATTVLFSISSIIFSTLVSAKSEFDRRIVALGDLHGDLPNTLEILKFSNIIDEDHHWIGGDAIFVQTVIINLCIRLLFYLYIFYVIRATW